MAGGILPGGLGGRRGAGVRGGIRGTPFSLQSVDKGRGGRGGVLSLGLGGGNGELSGSAEESGLFSFLVSVVAITP